MKKILIIGGRGQLGQCLQAELMPDANLNVIFLSSAEADVSSLDSLRKTVDFHKPDVLINCAAYTAVDRAEDEPEQAFLLNEQGPANLADICKEQDAFLIHISTDFVFRGDVTVPLAETVHTDPLSIYGKSKQKGEEVLLSQIPNQCLIIRTSWLYSEFGHNFLKTMLRLSSEKTSVGVVWDQVGTPTYARDLAIFIWTCIEQNTPATGILHFSNEGVASWYDFAAAIFDFSGIPIELLPLKTEDYPAKAIRPRYSVLDKTKAKQVLDIRIDHWAQALKRCLARIDSANSK